jgi:glucan endo-1,3-alpha-glucosidase
MVNIVAAHASSPAMYKWNNKVLVSTYAGDQNNNNAFYAGVKSALGNQGINISFAPAFTGYRQASQAQQLLTNFPVVDGFFNWWSW